MEGRNNEQKFPSVLRDFVPFGAAAQKAEIQSNGEPNGEMNKTPTVKVKVDLMSSFSLIDDIPGLLARAQMHITCKPM